MMLYHRKVLRKLIAIWLFICVPLILFVAFKYAGNKRRSLKVVQAAKEADSLAPMAQQTSEPVVVHSQPVQVVHKLKEPVNKEVIDIDNAQPTNGNYGHQKDSAGHHATKKTNSGLNLQVAHTIATAVKNRSSTHLPSGYPFDDPKSQHHWRMTNHAEFSSPQLGIHAEMYQFEDDGFYGNGPLGHWDLDGKHKEKQVGYGKHYEDDRTLGDGQKHHAGHYDSEHLDEYYHDHDEHDDYEEEYDGYYDEHDEYDHYHDEHDKYDGHYDHHEDDHEPQHYRSGQENAPIGNHHWKNNMQRRHFESHWQKQGKHHSHVQDDKYTDGIKNHHQRSRMTSERPRAYTESMHSNQRMANQGYRNAQAEHYGKYA